MSRSVLDRTTRSADLPPGFGTSWSLQRVSALLVVLLVVAAGSGLFLPSYSAETPFARHGYRGADLVSVVLVVPLLGYSMWWARRGSARAQLLWLGALGYITYQYSYTFAYSWTRLFLVYLALLSLSAFTLAAALTGLRADDIAGRVDGHAPVRQTARFLTAVGVALGLMELVQIVPTVFTGDTPQLVLDTAHPTSPVYVLDLGFVVPLMLLAGWWLRHDRPWGYVAAPILLVKGVAVGAGLLAANLFAALDDADTDGALNVLWAVVAVGSAAVLWRFLRHVDDGRLDQAATSATPEARRG